MKFRIRECNSGYIVEVQKFRNYIIFKSYYWECYINVNGMNKSPWYHATEEGAMINLLDNVKYNTIANSGNYHYEM
jgi:hypothetical protein